MNESIDQLIIYMKKLLDCDWLSSAIRNSVQKCLIPFNYSYKKHNLIGTETLLFKINQSWAITCYAWCGKRLDISHKALTVANLLCVNANAEAVRVV